MTNEELEKKAEDAAFDYSFDNPKAEYFNSDLEYMYIKGFKDGSGVIWHDLRKNSDDLPEPEKLVLDEYGNMVFFYNGNWYYENDPHTFSTEEISVDAWCEVPKFEEKYIDE